MGVGAKVAPDGLDGAGFQQDDQADVPARIVAHAEQSLMKLSVDNFYLDDLSLLRVDGGRQVQVAIAVAGGFAASVVAVSQHRSVANLEGHPNVAVVESVFHAHIVPDRAPGRQSPQTLIQDSCSSHVGAAKRVKTLFT